MQAGSVTSKINHALNSHAGNLPSRLPQVASPKVEGRKGRKEKAGEARNKERRKVEGRKTGKQEGEEKEEIK